MALAFQWQRAAFACACLLALGACEGVSAPDAPEAPTAAALDRSPRVASELARGRQALAAGDLSTAQAAFTGALRGSPNDPEPAIGLAETYLALGDLQTAERLFGLVAGAGGRADDPRLLQGRGLVALGQGRTDEAIGHLEQSVERDPDLWRAWAGLGRAYGRKGNARQARNAFKRAEESAPSPAVVINDTGMLHLEENDPAAALDAFQRALAVDPGNATASANARIARAMLGDYDAAISGARPDELPHVLNNVGYIAIVNGDFDVADRLLRRAIETSPVYHEAASANLDLLAQAMKGVPVVAVAAPGEGVERTADATPPRSGVANAARTADAAIAAVGSGVPTDAWSSIDSEDAGDTAPRQASASAGTPPMLDLASIPPQRGAETGVMAHGFRWESQPVNTAATGKKRGKRKAARPSASPDAADPRSAAWPAISVPAEAAPPASSADTQAAGSPQPPADDRRASAGSGGAAGSAAPVAATASPAPTGGQGTRPGSPE